VRSAVALVLAVACGAPSRPPIANTPAASVPPLRERAFAVHGHVTVLKSQVTFAEYPDIVRAATQIAGVTSAEPFTIADVMVRTRRGTSAPGVVKGILPEGVGRAHVARFVRDGAFDLAPATVVLGDRLASTLGVHVGDPLVLAVVDAGEPHMTVVRVAGTFHVDIDHYDTQLAFVALSEFQKLIARGDVVSGVEIRVADSDRAPVIARELDKAVGGLPYDVKDWNQLNPQLAP